MKLKLVVLFFALFLYQSLVMADTLVPPSTILASGFEDIPKIRIAGDGSLAFSSNMAISNPVEFPSATSYKITVNAYGTDVNGIYPNMNVYIDDTLIGSATVSSRTAENYIFTHRAVAAVGTLKLAFTNDRQISATQDRNLYIQSVGISPASVTQSVPSTVEAANFGVKTAGTLDSDGSWRLTENGYIGDDYLLTARTDYDFAISAYGYPSAGEYPELNVYIDSYLIQTLIISNSALIEHRFSYALSEGGTRRIRFSLANPSAEQDRRLNLKTVLVSTASSSSSSGSSSSSTSSGAITYDFTDGDSLAAKGDWSFDSPNWGITQVDGSHFKGIGFTYPARTASFSSIREMRFKAPHSNKFWIQFRLHIPTNYAHRSDTQLEIAAESFEDWQIGDRILGADGISEGIISGFRRVQIDNVPTGVILRNPPQHQNTSVWTGRVQNLTRGQSAVSTGRRGWSSNNKLFAMWADGYSSKGIGSTIIWELWPVAVPPGQTSRATNLAVHYSTGNNTVAGKHFLAGSGPFIAPGDAGKYIDVVVHGQFSSSAGARDGVIQTWVRKEDAISFTRVHNLVDADMDKRVDLEAGLQQWQAGYLLGWSNSGFDEETTFHISKIQYFFDQPEELALERDPGSVAVSQ